MSAGSLRACRAASRASVTSRAHKTRITDHRRRNDEQITALRAYLENDREDLALAKQDLEAAVTELLMVDSHEPRTSPQADELPDEDDPRPQENP